MLVFLAVLLVALFVFDGSVCVFGFVDEGDAWSAIVDGEERILECYGAVADADEAGADVAGLLSRLNEAGWWLSRARVAYGMNDSGLVLDFVNESRKELEGFVGEADDLKVSALERGYWDFVVWFVGSLVGGGLVVAAGVVVWFLLKRRFGVGKVGEYGVLFMVVVGVAALVVASPGLSRLLVYPRTEFFTEFWILDADGRAEDYPFNVSSGRDYGVFLGVGNRLGYCGYYRVMVKFRNLTQRGPSSFDGAPSGLPSLFNVSVFVEDEGVWQKPMAFSFDYECNETAERMEFDSLTFNDVWLDMDDYQIRWNSADNGFFGFLFFELWVYDEASGGFGYDEFLRLKLNMTGC